MKVLPCESSGVFFSTSNRIERRWVFSSFCARTNQRSRSDRVLLLACLFLCFSVCLFSVVSYPAKPGDHARPIQHRYVSVLFLNYSKNYSHSKRIKVKVRRFHKAPILTASTLNLVKNLNLIQRVCKKNIKQFKKMSEASYVRPM